MSKWTLRAAMYLKTTQRLCILFITLGPVVSPSIISQCIFYHMYLKSLHSKICRQDKIYSFIKSRKLNPFRTYERSMCGGLLIELLAYLAGCLAVCVLKLQETFTC